MLKIERQNKILEYLSKNGSLAISKISKEYKCSEETIRNDLIELEKEGKLIRIHGGAYIEEKYDRGFSIDIRETLLREEKKYIAKLAFKFIKEGNTITLDSSTTSIEFVKKILEEKISITIITNSLQIGNLCSDSENITLILIGGKLKKKNKSFVGYHTTEILDMYSSDVSFASYPSIDYKLGLGDNNIEELKVRETMLKNSKKKILLMDHTKFNEKNTVIFSKNLDIDYIITDKNINENWKEFLKNKKIKVVYE